MGACCCPHTTYREKLQRFVTSIKVDALEGVQNCLAWTSPWLVKFHNCTHTSMHQLVQLLCQEGMLDIPLTGLAHAVHGSTGACWLRKTESEG